MNKEEFEKAWLHNKQTMEEYEKNNLKYDVWQYYKLKSNIIMALDAIEEKKKTYSLMSKKQRDQRKILNSFKDLLIEIYNDMDDYDYFAFQRMYAQKREKDLGTIQSLIGDKDSRMLASSILLCDYSKASGREPDDVLSEYTYLDYLKEHNDQDFIKRFNLEENDTKKKTR